MLPKAKQSIDTDELKASDWYQFGYSEIKNNKYAKLLIPNHSTANGSFMGIGPVLYSLLTIRVRIIR